MDGDKDKFLDQVQNDLKNISLESKKSKQLQSLREATEEAIVKVRSAAGTPDPGLYGVANQVLYPLVQGCESKDGKVVKLCLSLMQRLIINKVINFKGGKNITDTLWMLMEAGIEEVKILQTITLLLTSNFVVQHETLAKCLVICFRLNFTKDSSINKIAGATVRQLVPVVFERVISAPSSVTDCLREQPSPNFQALINQMLPKNTDPFVVDAYLMFQDIVLLISAEQPIWLSGIMEMTRSFGLELLESILKKFTSIFKEHDEFKLLLKERVCSLVIKLFSPNTKYRNTSMLSASSSNNGSGLQDKPYYPITSKLLRVVSILILEYHQLLTTETEIFLSLVMKFLDPDKASWQNNIALEVIHKITVDSDLLIFICDTFDTNDLSTKVFQDIINGLGSYVQNVMMQQSSEHSDSKAPGPVAYGSTHPQAGFYHRNVWKPLTMSFVGGQTKEIYLDTAGGDKSDVPVVSDGYGVTLAYTCLLDTVRSLSIIMNRMEKPETIPYMKQLVNSR